MRSSKSGKTIAVIAEEVEESEEYVSRICDIASEFAPEYDSEKIYEKLKLTENS